MALHISGLRWQWPDLSFIVAAAVLALGTGCSTSFKYTPKHERVYSPIANDRGLAIRTGTDSRPPEERRPGWTKDAEAAVERALADETRHAKLFRRVKIHANSVNSKKHSVIVQFRVIRFECQARSVFWEWTARKILRFQALRGAFIAASIPTKYVSVVEIEFEVLDASTKRSVFVKSYSATRSERFNGYQGDKPKVQQTSSALEAVITEFVADLTKLPLCQRTDQIPSSR